MTNFSPKSSLEAKAPRLRMNRPSLVPQPQPGSIRSDILVTMIELQPPPSLQSNCKPSLFKTSAGAASPEKIHKLWLSTRKLATRIADGDYIFRLGLVDDASTAGSDLRDAVIDAMTEFMDGYGNRTAWWYLKGTTDGYYWCPMWRLPCFHFALSTSPWYWPAIHGVLESALRNLLRWILRGVCSENWRRCRATRLIERHGLTAWRTTSAGSMSTRLELAGEAVTRMRRTISGVAQS
ncbi:hypothetical protein EJ02DRAFT_479084 [Clathrospora elynae]|uniref:Uncharacterized protein n=1 Tax=Clathrospora elynae TaxID=706981 RepID=A0A6A5S804_9PLEO|nr:hypothetical protein EJ02DRAFT_479084 [Clathrospora elynae]